MWYERRAEDAEMFVRLKLWARLRRKSHVVWHFSIKEANSQLRYSSRSRDFLRCLQAAGFDSRFRRAVFCYGRRCSTVGHLNMDQANNRQQHSPCSRGIRCVSTSKVGSTPAFAPKFPIASVAQWSVQPTLNRKVVSSSLTGGTRGSSKLPYADDILPGTLRPHARRSPCRGITGSQGKHFRGVA